MLGGGAGTAIGGGGGGGGPSGAGVAGCKRQLPEGWDDDSSSSSRPSADEGHDDGPAPGAPAPAAAAPSPAEVPRDIAGAFAAVGAATTAVSAARNAVDEADAQHAQLLGASVPPPQAEIGAAAAEAARRGQELSHRQLELAAAEANLESLVGSC